MGSFGYFKKFRYCFGILFFLYTFIFSDSVSHFFTPDKLSGADYVIEARILLRDKQVLIEGTQRVTFSNQSVKPIQVIAILWNGRMLNVNHGHVKLVQVALEAEKFRALRYYRLHKPLLMGEKISLNMGFKDKRSLRDPALIKLQRWNPFLHWEGIPTRDHYQVKMDVPDGYIKMLSGRLNKSTGYYENSNVTSQFGMVLSKGYHVDFREIDGVLITALYNTEGKDCVQLCLNTAQDVIKFYKGYHGFYPFRFLNIIPGYPKPWGG